MLTLHLDIKPSTEKKLKQLLSNTNKHDEFFQGIIENKINELKIGIYNIEKHMSVYEFRYNIQSDQFYLDYQEGKHDLSEDDFIIWAGIYEMMQKNKQELNTLEW